MSRCQAALINNRNGQKTTIASLSNRLAETKNPLSTAEDAAQRRRGSLRLHTLCRRFEQPQSGETILHRRLDVVRHRDRQRIPQHLIGRVRVAREFVEDRRAPLASPSERAPASQVRGGGCSRIFPEEYYPALSLTPSPALPRIPLGRGGVFI